MREEDDRTFQLIGFLQDAFAPNLRKAQGSNSVVRWLIGYSKLDQVYRHLTVSEMLLWTRLGEAVGYFPKDTAEKLWVSTRRQLSIFAHNIIQSAPHLQPELKPELNYWSWVCDATTPRFFELFDGYPVETKRNRELRSWFRTQLLLAQRFGKYRPSKILLASLVILDDEKWSSLLYRLYASSDRKHLKTTLNDVGRLLTHGRSEFDQDVGIAPVTPAEVIAGFLLTWDQIAQRNTHNKAPGFNSDVSLVSGTIRASRLNFESMLVLKRFRSLTRFVERFQERIMLIDARIGYIKPAMALLLQPKLNESLQLLIEQWCPLEVRLEEGERESVLGVPPNNKLTRRYVSR